MRKTLALMALWGLSACAPAAQVTLHDRGVLQNADFHNVQIIVDGRDTLIKDVDVSGPAIGWRGDALPSAAVFATPDTTR